MGLTSYGGPIMVMDFSLNDIMIRMTSLNGEIFRITLWGESICHRWIPLIKAEFYWYFLWSVPEQTGWANNRRHRAHYDVTVKTHAEFSLSVCDDPNCQRCTYRADQCVMCKDGFYNTAQGCIKHHSCKDTVKNCQQYGCEKRSMIRCRRDHCLQDYVFKNGVCVEGIHIKRHDALGPVSI